jgi:hypothetical protein
MATNSEKPPRRRGRPSKAEELQAAMRALAIDPRTVDPLAVLVGIMMDATLPASARVQAARLLIAHRGPAETKQLQGKSKAGARPGKRALAEQRAATAGQGSPWGSDLDWSNGRARPQ